MSNNFLHRKVTVGAQLAVSGTAPPPPSAANILGIATGNSSVALSSGSTTTVSVVLRRLQGTSGTCSVDYTWTTDAPSGALSGGSTSGNGTASWADSDVADKTVSVVYATSSPGTNYNHSLSISNAVNATIRGDTVTLSLVRPTAVNPTAENDAFDATIGATTAMPVTGNDTNASAITSITITSAPSSGIASVRASDFNILYTPESGATDGSTTTLTYTVQPGNDPATVTITRRAAPVLTSGWGPGPNSGLSQHWIGARLGTFAGYTVANLESNTFTFNSTSYQGLNRSLDVLDAWVNFDQMKLLSQADAWKWISGCSPSQNADDHTQFGGCLTTGQYPQLWNAAYQQRAMKFNIAINPPQLSTKQSDAQAAAGTWPNWQFWFDLSRGVYNTHFYRLGKRMAKKDEDASIQVGTSSGHLRANGVPKGLRICIWAWEANQYQRWSFWEAVVPSTNTDPTYVNGKKAETVAAAAFEQIITAFNNGYLAYNGKNCPYYHGVRYVVPKVNGKTMKQSLIGLPKGLLKVVGQSQHHNKLYSAPVNAPSNMANNNGIWYNSGNNEGLNSIGELATGLSNSTTKVAVWLDESGQHFAGGYEPQGGAYPDYWIDSLNEFFKQNPGLAGGWSFYQGDAAESPVNVSSTSLLVNPNPTSTYAGTRRWPQANAKFLELYRYS